MPTTGPRLTNAMEKSHQKRTRWDWLILAAKFAFVLLLVVALLRVLTIGFGYNLFIDLSMSLLGLDLAYARPVAVLLTLASLTVVPWIAWYILFGRKKTEVKATAFLVACALAVAAYFSGDVLFDRTTGEAQKCYAKTTQGFKFSSVCDYDPELGVRFHEITPEVAKEIAVWKQTGENGEPPVHVPGKFFDSLTGEAKSWYVIQPDGSLYVSTLPGYDELTGEKLLPMTKEIVEQFQLTKKSHQGGIYKPPAPKVQEESSNRPDVKRVTKPWPTQVNYGEGFEVVCGAFREMVSELVWKRGIEGSVLHSKMDAYETQHGSLLERCSRPVESVWSDVYDFNGIEVSVEGIVRYDSYTVLIVGFANISQEDVNDDPMPSYRVVDRNGVEKSVVLRDSRHRGVISALYDSSILSMAKGARASTLVVVDTADVRDFNHGMLQFNGFDLHFEALRPIPEGADLGKLQEFEEGLR